eukprot:TRINITY_DN1584_c0_g1_i1.p1 TRINITY_DN1584_c0_g1~~TRINITY_DN1584_c0_g1_i1.p1  ORF type:complete len:1631 (+),score=403.07 TRINITY_DN1584_c0_g1_i1:456-4895(+)
MRWGIRDESTEDHLTSTLCMREIERCQEESVACNFVTFYGNKYGYRPFPAKIEKQEFEKLLVSVEKTTQTKDQGQREVSLLRKWFWLDENNQPEQYRLQTISVVLKDYNNHLEPEKKREARGQWWADFEDMQRALRRGAPKALSEDRAVYYIMSVTEEEIRHGILEAKRKDQTYYFRRNLHNIKVDDPEARNFIDVIYQNNKAQVDDEAQKHLNFLKDTLIPKAFEQDKVKGHIITYDLEWSALGINLKEHEKYLKLITDQFCHTICESMIAGIQNDTLSHPDHLYDEALEHSIFCQKKTETFVGRDEIIEKIFHYLDSDSSQIHVVYGQSGSGKTSVMAKVAQTYLQRLREKKDKIDSSERRNGEETEGKQNGEVNQGPVCLIRFIGTSGESCNIRSLLSNLIKTLTLIYGLGPEDEESLQNSIPTTYKGLVDHFKNVLSCCSDVNRPLYIFLDSLDQLSNEDNARDSLDWLPLSLPENVKLVVSTIPDYEMKLSSTSIVTIRCLSVLSRKLGIHLLNQSNDEKKQDVDPEEEIKRKNLFTEVRLVPQKEVSKMLENYLKTKNRKLQKKQSEKVNKLIEQNSLVLYLKLVADIVVNIPSYIDERAELMNIAPTIEGVIASYFSRLSKYHGQLLVSGIFSYISASKEGLSESELEDVLALDDIVLDDIYQYWVPPIRRLPPLLWKRLYYELNDYLTFRASKNNTSLLLNWYHRQFIEHSISRYLSTPSQIFQRHQHLSHYFLGIYANGKPHKSPQNKEEVLYDRKISGQPLVFSVEPKGMKKEKMWNVRKLVETPHHLIMTKDKTALLDLFCSLQFLEGKFSQGLGPDLIEEFLSAIDIFQEKTSSSAPSTSTTTTTTTTTSGDSELKKLAETLQFAREKAHILSRDSPSIYQLAYELPERHHLFQQLKSLTSENGEKLIDDLGLILLKTKKQPDANPCILILDSGGTQNRAMFSPSGKYILIADGSFSVSLWEVHRGMQLKFLQFEEDVWWIDWLSDESRFLISLGTKVIVYDFQSFSEIGRFEDDSNSANVDSFAVSPSDEHMVVTYNDGTLRIWRISDRTCLQVLEGAHGGPIPYCGFSNSGRKFGTTGYDGIMKIWSFDEQALNIQELFRIEVTDDRLWGCSFTPDENLVFVGSDNGWFKMYSLIDGSEKFQCTPSPAGAPIKCPSVSPDGQYVAVGSDLGELKIFSVPKFEPVCVLGGHPGCIPTVQWSSNQELLLSCSYDSTARLWRLNNLSPQQPPPLRCHSDAVSEVCWSPDSQLIASSSMDGGFKFWKLNEDGGKGDSVPGLKMVRGTRCHQGGCSKSAFSPDGKIFVTTGGDRVIKVWKTEEIGTPPDLLLNSHTISIDSCLFFPNGKHMVTVDIRGLMTVWSFNGSEFTERERIRLDTRSKAPSVSKDGKYFLVSSREFSRVYDIETLAIVYQLPPDLVGAETSGGAFSPDNKKSHLCAYTVPIGFGLLRFLTKFSLSIRDRYLGTKL